MKKQTDQRGVLLLIALVMTMVLLVASSILTTIVIREARVSGLVDQGITAFYGTESSVESAMYQIFKLGSDPVTLDGTTGSSQSGGTWSRSAKNTTDEFIFDVLVPGDQKELVIYNTDNPAQASNVSGLQLNWSSGDGIQYQTATWDGASLTPGTSGTISGVTSGTISLSGGVHQVLLSATQTVTDLTITTIPNGTMVTIPVTVTVLGEYQGSEQAVELVLPVPAPWNAPAAICGNSTIETGEQCDDGNTTDGDGCDSSCQNEAPGAICGNTIVETGEQCDDGNTTNGDGCDSSCQNEGATCGNGAVEVPEVCDDGDAGNSGTCNATCTALTTCGDSVVQTPNGNPGTNEQCDDGNTTDGDGCDSTCQDEPAAAVCGNNITEPGEECDGTDYIIDGQYAPHAQNVCSGSCTYNTCFDAVFSNASMGLNAVTPAFPAPWSYYTSNSYPTVNGVLYDNPTMTSQISGSCTSNCSGYTADSPASLFIGPTIWRYDQLGEWDQISPPPPLVRYSGSVRFCI